MEQTGQLSPSGDEDQGSMGLHEIWLEPCSQRYSNCMTGVEVPRLLIGPLDVFRQFQVPLIHRQYGVVQVHIVV